MQYHMSNISHLNLWHHRNTYQIMPSLNVAMLGQDFFWGGGTELIRIIANALLADHDGHRIRLFLLLPVLNQVDTLADLRGNLLRTFRHLRHERKFVYPLRKPRFDTGVLDYISHIDGPLELIEYNVVTGLIAALSRINADVILPAANNLGPSFHIPWVGYIYDFQHKYLPGFFTPRECLQRDIHFACMLRDAKAVIVNSQAVKNDINKFFPYHDCNVFDLPFSAAPVTKWLEDDDPDQLSHYNLPSRYLLISNQFWIHKSHSTAFKALALLKGDPKHSDLHIVCTGKMDDYRFPDYIQDLQLEIRELGLEQSVHLLGHIPKIDQIAIMKESLAVLQPSLFEGGPGGGSVYDAISLGVPAIISDILVNREIEKEQNVFYFVAGSETDLANKVGKFLKKEIHRPDKVELTQKGKWHKRVLGERLLEAIDCAISAR